MVGVERGQKERRHRHAIEKEKIDEDAGVVSVAIDPQLRG